MKYIIKEEVEIQWEGYIGDDPLKKLIKTNYAKRN